MREIIIKELEELAKEYNEACDLAMKGVLNKKSHDRITESIEEKILDLVINHDFFDIKDDDNK